MSKHTCSCGKKITDEQVFSYGGEALCEDCYLGETGRGPLGDQYSECPKCGHTVHRSTAYCDNCRSLVREIGKVESAARGTATKGIVFVVSIVLMAMAAMVLGAHRANGAYSLAAAIPMAVGAFLLGVNGMLGLLYFRFFALVTWVRGIVGFAVGGASLALSIVLYVLLI